MGCCMNGAPSDCAQLPLHSPHGQRIRIEEKQKLLSDRIGSHNFLCSNTLSCFTSRPWSIKLSSVEPDTIRLAYIYLGPGHVKCCDLQIHNCMCAMLVLGSPVGVIREGLLTRNRLKLAQNISSIRFSQTTTK